MNIHEYQAKELLKARGIPVLDGGVAYTADEAVEVAEKLDGDIYVVKAQIHAGAVKAAGLNLPNLWTKYAHMPKKLLACS